MQKVRSASGWTYEDGYNNALDAAEVAIEGLYQKRGIMEAPSLDDIRSVLRTLMDSDDK
jgi:hypothetical protein